MNINSSTPNTQPRVVAFVNCDSATTFGRFVRLTADEERRLGNVLAALRDWGLILGADVTTAAARRLASGQAVAVIAPPGRPRWCRSAAARR